MVTCVQGCKVNKKSRETLSYSHWLGFVQDPREVSHPSQIAEKKETEEYDMLTTQRTLLVMLERFTQGWDKMGGKSRDNGACGRGGEGQGT